MKLNFKIFIFFLCFNFPLLAQNNKGKYNEIQVENFIKEVFNEKANELVFNSNSKRLELITNFLNRIEIIERTDLKNKDIPLLSTIPLNNKYNINIKRDVFIDKNTFNPLKYKFNMNSNEMLLYRIDNSDFIIRIYPNS